MENSAPIHHHHQTMPLASCEARARLAFHRGQISQAAYQSLMGITAEVLLLNQHAEEGRVGESTENEKTAPRKQITPCDTPPISRREESPSPKRKPMIPKLQLPEDYVTTNYEEGLKLCLRDQSRNEYAGDLERSLPCTDTTSPNADSDKPQLEKMRDQGFGLCARARRYWSEEEGLRSPDENDQSLLEFVDVCLKTYPPSSLFETHDASDSFRDIIWQNRLGLVAPTDGRSRPNKTTMRIESENARWEVRFEHLLRFKAIHAHCNVPFRYGLNKPLGGWVQKQRDLEKKGKLPKSRFERLDQVGFSWVLTRRKIPKINDDSIHSYEDLWEVRFKCLVDFKRSNGNCNVPYRYAKDMQLGRWVQNQREFFKRKTLSSERFQRLVELGFVWSLRKGAKWGAASLVGDVARRNYLVHNKTSI